MKTTLSAHMRRTTLSVLVVDDDDVLRASMRAMIQAYGASLLEAMDAPQALTLLRMGYRPGIVVTDLFMPAMDGLEFAQQIRRACTAQKILLVTGLPPQAPQYARVEKALEEGLITAVLNRPFTALEFEGALDALLDAS